MTENYVVITVSNIPARDKLIKQLYTNLTKEPERASGFIVQQDQINRIKILQNCGKGVYVPIRTYLVIVIPVLIDLNPLYNFQGTVDYHLGETIEHLQKLTAKLQSLSGRRVMKGNTEAKFRGLVENLSRSL